MKKISLIIPVYNVEGLIVNCLQSVTSQTLQDIEVILVDDHGKDDSIAVAQKYIANYNGDISFQILATDANSGPGEARNVGIKHASGEYIAFLDSDDTIESTFCEKLYSAATKHDADLAYSHLHFVTDGSQRTIKKNPIVESGDFSFQKKVNYLNTFITFVYSYIYKKDFLKNNEILFPRTKSSEDSYFLTCALLNAQTIACVDEPLYNYFIMQSSSLTNTKNPLRYKDKLLSFSYLIKYTKEHNLYDTYQAEIDYIYLKKGYFTSVFNYFVNNDIVKKEAVNEIFETLKKDIPFYKKNKYFKKRKSLPLLMYLINNCPKIAAKLIKSYSKKKKLKL